MIGTASEDNEMLCCPSVCQMKVEFDTFSLGHVRYISILTWLQRFPDIEIQYMFLYFRAVTMELLFWQPSKETYMISARTLWELCWDAITTGKRLVS